MSTLIRKYYLLPEGSFTRKGDKFLLKKIESSSTWEKEAFDLLTDEHLVEVKKKESLTKLFDSLKEGANEADGKTPHDILINLLPKNIRSKSKGLLWYLTKITDINSEGQLVHKDSGIVGGTLVDTLKYLTTPNYRVAPPDLLPLLERLYEMKCPLSLFARNKTPSVLLTKLKEPPEPSMKWKTVD